MPAPGTKPVPSSCQGTYNTHPTPKQPLGRRMEPTLAQNPSRRKGGFPRESLLWESPGQLGTVTTEPVQPQRINATCAWADGCQATRSGPTATSWQQQEAALPPPTATPPREAPSPGGTTSHCSLRGDSRALQLRPGQPRHGESCGTASVLTQRLAQPWGLHPARQADAGSQRSGASGGLWTSRGSRNTG